MKILKKCLCLILTVIIISASCGCSQKRNYGEEYNYETDCQYSYYNSFSYWKKIQSDGAGQYILKNNYIYYYSPETKKMAPLCNKANCLHDMETDKDRMSDCNAYARVHIGNNFIQYYDGYVYYFSAQDNYDIFSNSLYRVKKDGSQKDKIFTTDNEMPVNQWLLHRGYLYYETQTSHYGGTSYEEYKLKALELSSNMSEKNAKVIEKDDDEHTVLNFHGLSAYKNYLCYQMTAANEKDFRIPDDYDWESNKIYSSWYLYNIETEQADVIPIPEGCSETTNVSSVVFLKDKMLIKLYDRKNNFDYEYKLPIYSINYDLTDEKIWLDDVEQGKFVQTYDDYVIISDAQLHYKTIITEEGTYKDVLKDDKPCMNVEIYSADAKRVSYFVYPMNVMGNFNGFGPDGVNVEFDEDDNSWSVYELNFKDVLNCHGEEVKLDLVSTRRFGALNKEDY